MVRYHPEDEVLLSLASGHLHFGATVLVSVHLEYCSQCRARVQMLQAIGGALLERAEPRPLGMQALATTLQQIDDSARADVGAAAKAPASLPQPALLKDVPSLESLRTCKLSRWYWIGPGRRLSRVQPLQEAGSSLFLLKIAPGRSLPRHSHTGLEFTQVLSGSFHNGVTVLGPGDFDMALREVHHQPVAQPGGVCVCLLWSEGQLRFDRRALRPIARWLGL